MTPRRVQRRRVKGWRMPPNTLYVGRPGRWGNPYVVGEAYIVDRVLDFPLPTSRVPGEPVGTTSARVVLCKSPAQAVRWYRKWLTVATGPQAHDRLNLEDLRGSNLACWCGEGEPCHVDVLLELANPPAAVAADVAPAQLTEPTPEALRGVPTRPKYSQLSLPGTPSRPRRHGSTVRAHCTSCGRFAANPSKSTDTGFCVVHGACHLTWG